MNGGKPIAQGGPARGDRLEAGWGQEAPRAIIAAEDGRDHPQVMGLPHVIHRHRMVSSA
ncbi:hypothetical protein EKD04_013570 [Chloroflexales bacterium ZM16-3]|nr:hypothetical protein [Chloroflexales bacterium ZM16-3]